MKNILLDTNFLMIPASLGVDIFTEIDRISDFKHEICVLDKTVDELKRIAETQKGRHRDAAKLALQLVARKGIVIVQTKNNLNVDDLILKNVNSKSFIVATQDRELKRRLKTRKVPVIVLRQKKYLQIVEA
jgi:rRNA-processing protein FCF1